MYTYISHFILRHIIYVCIALATLYTGIYSHGVYAVGSTDDIRNEKFEIDVDALSPLGSKVNTSDSVDGIQELLGKVAGVLLMLVPILAVVAGIVSGYIFLTSAGDTERVGKAKTIIKMNIIAICIAFGAYTIVQLVAWLVT